MPKVETIIKLIGFLKLHEGKSYFDEKILVD